MYNMTEFKLKVYYEEIMTENVTDDLPRHFCYECATMLYKYHKFREKCLTGQEILKELWKKGPITLSSISKVDRKNKNLLSTIEVMPESKRFLTITGVNTVPDSLYIKTEGETIISEDIETEIELNEECCVNNEYKYDEEGLEIEEDSLKMEKENVDEQNMDCSFEKCDGEWETVLNDDKPIVIVVEENWTRKNNIKNKKQTKTKQDVINKRKTKKAKKTSKSDKKRGGLPKRMLLDPEHWLKISLNEDEALENFKLRAKDPKYLKAMYKCVSCYTTFSTQEIMDRHMKLNHCESRGLHECQFCHKRYKMKCLVTQHIIVHYNKFKCLRCDLTFHSEHSASNHNDFHSGVKLPCKHCGLEFRHKSSYYSHLRIYHRSDHVCPLCGESFVSRKGLQQHKILKHLNAEINRNENEDQTTYCERCDIKFETQKAYSEHFQQSVKHANDFQLSEDQELVGTSDAPAPLKGGAAKTFTRVNSSRPTTCPVCEKLFRSYSQYVKHHRAEHKGVPVPCDVTQVCEVCGVTVKGGAIGIHMNVHTKEKIYSCQTCGAQFFYLTSFTRHQLTHTGEKPFKCPLCEKRFTQKTSMQLHHRTFHLKQPYPKRIRKKESIAVQEREDISECSDEYSAECYK
ncbi:unnamed protein product [Arctia plantaginis]|uniref:C2H2-type domain-containing protein n=1 Tax=Arctia plantaginis TaxID=874455 RepID=A0A8S1APS1_ARCPL|nr:unnamed protein product [Arctia plantaginis]